MLAYALVAFGLTWFVMLGTDVLRLVANGREVLTAAYLTLAALMAVGGVLLARFNPDHTGATLGIILGGVLEYALRRILRPKWVEGVHRAAGRVNDRSWSPDGGTPWTCWRSADGIAYPEVRDPSGTAGVHPVWLARRMADLKTLARYGMPLPAAVMDGLGAHPDA